MVSKSFALSIVLAATLSCSLSPTDKSVPPPAHDIEIVQNAPEAGPNAFTPHDTVISLTNQNTVTWYNADFAFYGGGAGISHHLVSDDGTTFDSDNFAPNAIFQATFAKPGTYTYHCEYHPGMTGTITVNP